MPASSVSPSSLRSDRLMPPLACPVTAPIAAPPPAPTASAPRMPTGGNRAAATPAARPQPSPTAAPCRVGCSCFLTMLTLPASSLAMTAASKSCEVFTA